MSSLCTAIYTKNNVWYMRSLANVVPPFPELKFAGATEAEQAQAVQKLGMLMRSNDSPEIVSNIPSLFPDAESSAKEIYNQAFQWADAMQLPGESQIITAEQFGEEVVDEALPEFADLLLAFFPLATLKGVSLETARMARALERKVPGAAKKILSADDSFTYSMTFQNYGSETFPLYDFETQMQAGVSTITQQPSQDPDLTPFGSQTLAWTEMLSNIASGDTWGDLIYYIPSANAYIGIKIIVPVQVFDIGPAPYYEVWVNNSWTGDYTSQGYTYAPIPGYSVSITPVAGHTSLSITIQISPTGDAMRQKLKAPPKGQQRRKLLTDREKKVQAEWTKTLQSRKGT